MGIYIYDQLCRPIGYCLLSAANSTCLFASAFIDHLLPYTLKTGILSNFTKQRLNLN